MTDHARDLLWWPSDYVDEVMPPGRDSAEAWLSKRADGSWQLGGPTGDTPNLAALNIEDGQWAIFSVCEMLGKGSVNVFDKDGKRQIICDGIIPSGANWFAIMDEFESDTVSGSVEETLQIFRELDPEPGSYSIGYERWDSENLIFDAATGTFSEAGKVS